MPDPVASKRAPTALSRRRLAALAIAGAFIGAAWTTGLAVTARDWRPRVSVVGDKGWQVLLFEHGSSRVLVLSGVFEESPEPAVEFLCGVLRQHLDVVAGSGEALALLSSGFRTRRAVSTIVQLDPLPGTSSSDTYIGLVEPISIQAGDLEIVLTPVWSGAWSQGPLVPQDWIGHAAVDGLTIGFGPSLDTIAEQGDPGASLAIAPAGNAGRLWRTLPGVAVATNARETLATFRSSGPDRVPAALVRTFPEDIALFRFKNGRLTLPAWVERGDRDLA